MVKSIDGQVIVLLICHLFLCCRLHLFVIVSSNPFHPLVSHSIPQINYKSTIFFYKLMCSQLFENLLQSKKRTLGRKMLAIADKTRTPSWIKNNSELEILLWQMRTYISEMIYRAKMINFDGGKTNLGLQTIQ